MSLPKAIERALSVSQQALDSTQTSNCLGQTRIPAHQLFQLRASFLQLPESKLHIGKREPVVIALRMFGQFLFQNMSGKCYPARP